MGVQAACDSIWLLKQPDHGRARMLYRRFILVASMIALMGVGFANLVLHTKAQRDVVLDYPNISRSLINLCSEERRCRVAVRTSPVNS